MQLYCYLLFLVLIAYQYGYTVSHGKCGNPASGPIVHSPGIVFGATPKVFPSLKRSQQGSSPLKMDGIPYDPFLLGPRLFSGANC